MYAPRYNSCKGTIPHNDLSACRAGSALDLNLFLRFGIPTHTIRTCTHTHMPGIYVYILKRPSSSSNAMPPIHNNTRAKSCPDLRDGDGDGVDDDDDVAYSSPSKWYVLETRCDCADAAAAAAAAGCWWWCCRSKPVDSVASTLLFPSLSLSLRLTLCVCHALSLLAVRSLSWSVGRKVLRYARDATL